MKKTCTDNLLNFSTYTGRNIKMTYHDQICDGISNRRGLGLGVSAFSTVVVVIGLGKETLSIPSLPQTSPSHWTTSVLRPLLRK